MPVIRTLFRTVKVLILLSFLFFSLKSFSQSPRTRMDFDKGWHFHLGDAAGAENPTMSDANWRALDLPHDWSIEGKFAKQNPATPEGGALPGGIGWQHQKTKRYISILMEFTRKARFG
jgi:beta-galactosidase